MIIQYSPKKNKDTICVEEYENFSKESINLEDFITFVDYLERYNTYFIFKGSASEVVTFEQILANHGYEYEHIETIKDGLSYFEAKFVILRKYV